MDTRSDISLTGQLTIFLTGKQLAKILDVAGATLSEAVKNGYNCGGEPVAEWAVVSGSGRIKGYEVPEYLVDKPANRKPEKRINPKPEHPIEANKSPNQLKTSPHKGDEDEMPADWQAMIDEYVKEQPPRVEVQKSMLPPDQNYAEPVGMASLASVLRKALDNNTPESRMLLFACMTGFGGLMGHTVNDNGWGAAAGALSSVGVMYFAYKWLNKPQSSPNQTNLGLEEYKRIQINRNIKNGQSNYLNN